MTNIIITGGCGFIGSRLTRHLNSNGNFKISIVDNFSEGSILDLSDIAESDILNRSDNAWSQQILVYEANIENIEEYRFLFKDADVIVHLAANTGVQPSIQDPMRDMRANVIGTLNILEAARFSKTVKQVIFASSSAPLAGQNPPLNEEMAAIPMSPYGASKLSGEGYCSAYYHSFGLGTTTLRFSNVYGPGSHRKKSIVAKAISHALDGEQIPVYGDGNQMRDFIYVDDLIEAIVKCINCQAVFGETLQISTGVGTSINRIISLIEKELLANNLQFTGFQNEPIKAGDAFRNISSNNKLKKLISWYPSTSIDTGISKTVKYFLSKKLK